MSVFSEVHGVREASRRMVRELGFLDAHNHAASLSHSECHALIEIGQAGTISAGDLAVILQLDKASVSRVVTALIAKDLVRVRMEALGDKRRKPLELRAKGRHKLDSLHVHANAQVQEALALLSTEERARVETGLQLYAKALSHVRTRKQNKQESLKIVPYEDRFREPIIQLILGIQNGEFGVPVTLDDQPDLKNIPVFFHPGESQFWVALIGNKVVGTIAMFDFGGNQVALRKMFVAKEYRGKEHGVSQALLTHLVEYCRKKNIRDIFLGTLNILHAAHRFYEKNGFSEIPQSALPSKFPLVHIDTKFYHLHVSSSTHMDIQPHSR